MKQNRTPNPRYKINMAGEKLHTVIEKYIAADILIMLLGLIHSDGTANGYPIPWLGRPGPAGGAAFLGSLVIVTLLVFAADIVTKILIRITEPVTPVQRTLAQYSSPYREYEDNDPPVRVNSSQPAYRAKPSTVPGASGTPGNAARKIADQARNYEQKMNEEYDKLRHKLSMMNSGSGKSAPAAPRPSAPASAAGSAGQNRRMRNKGKNDTALVVILIILGISFFLLQIVGSFYDDSYDYDDDWGENIEINDDSDSYENDELRAKCEDVLFDICFDTADHIPDTINKEEFTALSGIADLSYSSREVICEGFSEDGSAAVYRFRISDYDNNYYCAAILLECEDGEDIEADPENADVTGISVCKFETESDYEIRNTSGALSAGKDTLDGEHILQW